jgi:hypothetical protein
MSGSPRIYRGKERLSALDCHPACPGVPWNRSAPGFPTSLHYPKLRMRLSVKKAAYAVVSSAAYRKSGLSAGKAKPHESLSRRTAEENPSAP